MEQSTDSIFSAVEKQAELPDGRDEQRHRKRGESQKEEEEDKHSAPCSGGEGGVLVEGVAAWTTQVGRSSTIYYYWIGFCVEQLWTFIFL